MRTLLKPHRIRDKCLSATSIGETHAHTKRNDFDTETPLEPKMDPEMVSDMPEPHLESLRRFVAQS